MIKLLVTVVLVAVLGVACSSSSTSSTPTQSPFTGTSTITSSPTAIGTGTSSQTPGVATASPTISGSPIAMATSGTLRLAILAPANEILVDTNTITVKGQATAGADVFINGDFVNADASGAFNAMVTLDEGPNEIDVMASDDNENEVVLTLVIFYVK